MRDFDYKAPRSLSEALALLASANGDARALAGGTDLIDQMRVGRRTPALVVDVKGIPEMNRLEYSEPEGLRIGAAVSCRRIAEHPIVKEKYPILLDCCTLVGDIKIQNRAGIGGNLCNAAPSADTAPPIICLGGRALIAGPSRTRELLVADFFAGPGRTILEADELLVEVVIPPPPPNSAGHYLRFIPRNEMDIAVAGVGSLLILDPYNQQIQEARITLGAVAPTPIRAQEAEAYLKNKPVNSQLIQEAGRIAANEARPITDQRGSAEYRRELVNILTQRTLQASLNKLGIGIEGV